MSTVKFIEHQGKRIPLDEQAVTTEMRCDMCGEFIDRDDAVFIDISVTRYQGGLARPPLTADAHPSCTQKVISHFLTGPVT